MSTIKNTDGEDLFDWNSSLSSHNGKNTYRVDDSYFDDFSAKLNDAIAGQEEIKEEAPALYRIPVYNPFEVPVGYFDELPGHVQALISFQEPRFSIKEWLFQLIKPNFAFPVIITILIAGAAIRFIDKQAEQPKSELTADVSLEEQLDPIDENVIVDLLDDNTVDAEVKNSSDELITDYLIDNNVDETSLNVDLNTLEHENK
mgnify:CR=1 FL=1